MDKQKFIENFSEALELEDDSALTLETEFRNLPEWDSLSYLSIIAMLDDEYDIQIENIEFRKLVTLADIVNFIENNIK